MEVTEKIAEATSLSNAGNHVEALEMLLAIEKSSRMAVDIQGTVAASAAVMQVCYNAGDWKVLIEHILIISKRRAQVKQAIIKVVEMCMAWLNEQPSKFDPATVIELIETLRAVSAGKMFLEVERARLTARLAKIREDEGKIDEASDILQEISPETHGTMDKKEKVRFILEQIRLSLARKDYVRAGIISNKISEKTINGDELKDEKRRYNELMIEWFHHNYKFLDIAKAYHAIYSVAPSEAEAHEALQRVALFGVLSPYDNTQSDFINRIYQDRKLENIPIFRQLVKMVLTHELIRWPLPAELMAVIHDASPVWGGFFTPRISTDFRKRITEHNIRVISKYYSRIESGRLAQLLDLPLEESEERLGDMVTSGILYARIDRLAGVVSFRRPTVAADALNSWSTDITKLLETVEETCHLIRKESVLHGVTA